MKKSQAMNKPHCPYLIVQTGPHFELQESVLRGSIRVRREPSLVAAMRPQPRAKAFWRQNAYPAYPY